MSMGGMKIEKEPKKVVIFLQDLKVEGNIHLMPKTRLTDILNSNQIKDFIPITNATIEVLSTKETYAVELVEINKCEMRAVYLKSDEIV